MTNARKNKIYKIAYKKIKHDKKEENTKYTFLLLVGIMFLLMLQLADLKSDLISIICQIICYILVISAMLCSIWSIYHNYKYVKGFANDINDRLFDIYKTNQGDYELRIDDYTVVTVLKKEINNYW